MLTLSVIALASGLAFTPAQPGSYSTESVVRSERARLTLNQMTSVAQNRLRARNIEEALNSGIHTFKMALDQQLSDQTAQEVVVISVQESPKSVTIK
jgi:hypothetical protein